MTQQPSPHPPELTAHTTGLSNVSSQQASSLSQQLHSLQAEVHTHFWMVSWV